MKKEKYKIKFRKKEMSLLEAKAYLLGLKTHAISVDLSDEEKKEYLEDQESKRKGNEEFKRRTGKEGFWILSSERGYLINELSSKIGLAEMIKTSDYCREHGHKEKKSSSYFASGSNRGTRVYAHCSRCGQMYERGLTSKEWGEFDKSMRTPFTI